MSGLWSQFIISGEIKCPVFIEINWTKCKKSSEMKKNWEAMLKIVLKNVPLLAGIAQNVENVENLSEISTPYIKRDTSSYFYFISIFFLTFLT